MENNRDSSHVSERRSSSPFILDGSYITIGAAVAVIATLMLVSWNQGAWQTAMDYKLTIVSERVADIKEELKTRNESNSAEIRAIWVKLQELDNRTISQERTFHLRHAQEWAKELKHRNPELNVPPPRD